MRVPTTIEISLPDTVGPSSGDEAVTCSGPGRFCTGVPAQGMLASTLRHEMANHSGTEHAAQCRSPPERGQS